MAAEELLAHAPLQGAAHWLRLHNGQPIGAQDLTTTEDGAYFLNGVSQGNDTALEDVVRESDAIWAIASEDEWYKAAYHMNDGVTGNYWSNPTSAHGAVGHLLIDPDPGDNATCSGGTVGDWTIGAPYYRTEIGAHENSASPYGTFDQGGNVMEFTEAVPESDIRRIRGGSWNMRSMRAWSSEIPEDPQSLDLLVDQTPTRGIDGRSGPSLAGIPSIRLRTWGSGVRIPPGVPEPLVPLACEGASSPAPSVAPRGCPRGATVDRPSTVLQP